MTSVQAAQRAVLIEMHHHQGMSLTEIGEALGTNFYHVQKQMQQLNVQVRGGSRGKMWVGDEWDKPVIDCLDCRRPFGAGCAGCVNEAAE